MKLGWTNETVIDKQLQINLIGMKATRKESTGKERKLRVI